MIVICHPSPTIRANLRAQVAAVAAGQRVTTSTSVADLLVRVSGEQPSMIFLPLESAAELAPKLPQGVIVAITLPQPRRNELDAVRLAATAGVRGFLRTDASTSQVAALVREGANSAPAVVNDLNTRLLTKRETEVLSGMARGRSNAEIGRELFLSEDTIKTHARRLFRKLGAHDRAQAVAVGFRLGILQ